MACNCGKNIKVIPSKPSLFRRILSFLNFSPRIVRKSAISNTSGIRLTEFRKNS